jgi:hypothetical protein
LHNQFKNYMFRDISPCSPGGELTFHKDISPLSSGWHHIIFQKIITIHSHGCRNLKSRDPITGFQMAVGLHGQNRLKRVAFRNETPLGLQPAALKHVYSSCERNATQVRVERDFLGWAQCFLPTPASLCPHLPYRRETANCTVSYLFKNWISNYLTVSCDTVRWLTRRKSSQLTT